MDIAVDPRIELLMAVQSASAYRDDGPLLRAAVPHPYRDAAWDLAAQHADQAAVTRWRELHAAGFTFDAPVTFALCHTGLPELEPLCDYGSYLAGRAGGAGRLAGFAAGLRAFAAATAFARFLSDWGPTLRRFEAEARAVTDPAWPGRLDAYAGRRRAPLRVVLAPQSTGSYGPTLALPEGRVSYSVVAPAVGPAGVRFDDPATMRYLVLHEGAHAFVNDAMDSCAADVAASAALLEPIRERMARQAYGDWRSVVNEHVVRAIVARLGPDPGTVLEDEERSGFLHIRAVAGALEEYERARDRYSDLWAFAPRIAAVLAEIARSGAG